MTPVRAIVLLLMVALGVPALEGQQAVAPPPSSLSGVVLADDTGLPVPDANVRVYGSLVQMATTDEEGRFEIADITPGSHLVTAVKAGYALARAGQRYPSDTPSLVEFRPRAARNVEIRLTPLGAIAGTILDEKGQAVAAAQVVVSRAQTRDGCRGCQAVAVTDRNGRYRLTGLSDGRYYVMAIAPATRGADGSTVRESPTPAPGAPAGVAPPTRPITYYPGTSLPSQSATVSVAAGVQVEATFPLMPSAPARIAGTILDSRGAPVRDYLVMLDARPPQPQTLLPRYIEVWADGRFELKNVPPGDYTLLVRDQERFVLLAQTGSTLGQSFKGELADRRIQVPGDGLEDLHIVTRPGYELSGTVVMNGQPMHDLTKVGVAVTPTEFTLHPVSGASVLVQADGTFRLPNVTGTSRVHAFNLPAGLMVHRVVSGGVDVADFGVDIVQNMTVDVVIGPETQLRGRVTTRRGTSVPGMSVVIFAQDPRRWTIPDTPFVRRIPAETDGSFRVNGLPAGRYYAAAVVPQVESPDSSVDDLDVLIARAMQFDLANGEQQAITVRID